MNTTFVDIDDERELFAIRRTNLQNQLETMIEKTKRLENILRSELGLPMTLEHISNNNSNNSVNNLKTDFDNNLDDCNDCQGPPKKRMKYE